MKTIIVFNQFAANDRSLNLISEVKTELEKNEIIYDLELTESSENAVKLIRDINLDHYDAILTAGGDGTLFSMINGYMQNNSKKRIPIGIIPTGTGNAFARDLGFTGNNIADTIAAIKRRITKNVDIGKLITEGNTFYFANIIGLGFVTDVARTAHGLKMFGSASYTLGVLYHTLFLKPFQVIIEADGKTIKRSVIFIEISNTKYTGKDFLMAPSAKNDDGLFDITIMNKGTRLKLLSGLPKIFKGEHINMREVETIRAKDIKIKTDEPKVLTPDGEIFGSTPFEVVCIPEAIEFLINTHTD
ncbi:MAG: diacylglycerol kinase family lipid kinase [Melioribacteraceae bacterium]|nr:diacylglycerol kinase family lipid kinase [Melioribacteraceae bacterium]